MRRQLPVLALGSVLVIGLFLPLALKLSAPGFWFEVLLGGLMAGVCVEEPVELQVQDPIEQRDEPLINEFTGQPFPGNAIPQSRFDSTATKLLPLWPGPNFAGSSTRINFVSNPPSTVKRDNIDTRVDHNFSDKDKIFGRFSRQGFTSDIESIFPEPA